MEVNGVPPRNQKRTCDEGGEDGNENGADQECVNAKHGSQNEGETGASSQTGKGASHKSKVTSKGSAKEARGEPDGKDGGRGERLAILGANGGCDDDGEEGEEEEADDSALDSTLEDGTREEDISLLSTVGLFIDAASLEGPGGAPKARRPSEEEEEKTGDDPNDAENDADPFCGLQERRNCGKQTSFRVSTENVRACQIATTYAKRWCFHLHQLWQAG